MEEGTLLTSARLGALNLTDPDVLDMTGVLPYAYGNDSSVPLTYAGDYTAVDGFDQLADLDGVVLGLVALTDAEVLALAGEDDRSLLMFSGSGFDDLNSTSRSALIDWFDERSGAEDVHLSVLAVKLDAAEQAQASSGALSAMFLVFGTFTIAAGILLSLTIIMLLADVRRSEVATVRALGLRRSDARAMFTYEGATLAFIASGVGSVMGLGLAWLIAAGFSSIFFGRWGHEIRVRLDRGLLPRRLGVGCAVGGHHPLVGASTTPNSTSCGRFEELEPSSRTACPGACF